MTIGETVTAFIDPSELSLNEAIEPLSVKVPADAWDCVTTVAPRVVRMLLNALHVPLTPTMTC